jgi:hypothetical protein
MLDHQKKIAAEGNACGKPSDRQLNIPLIGEVRCPAEPAPKPARSRRKKSTQPKLADSL